MILELIEILGLSLSLALAFIVVYLFKFFRRYTKDPTAFEKSYSILIIFLIALTLHNLHHISHFFGLPNLKTVFELTSVLIFLYAIIKIVKIAIWVEVSEEVKKGDKVRELIEFRILEGRLNEASKELAKTNNFFSSIIQSSADAIIASDLNKLVTYFSKGAEELFERKKSEVIGTNVLELYPKEVLRKRDRIKRAKVLKKEGLIRNMEMRIFTPSGRPKTISLSLSLLRDAVDNVIGTVGVAKDITREVEAAGELRYLKELSDKILEGTPDGQLILDLDLRVKLINNGFEKITGIEKDIIVGKNSLELLKIPELENLFDAMDLKNKFVKVAYSAEPLNPEEFIIVVEGQPKTLTDYWTPLYDNNGNVEFVLIIIHDITKRKTLEDNLKEQAEMLKRSNDLKDIFTDIMRHDLLNPIGVIKNYVELMTPEDMSPFIHKSMDAISRNAGKAVEMIENASSLAKIESVEEIIFEERDLGEILKTAVESVVSPASKKEIEIELVAKGAYPARVSQVIEAIFLNFLTNAIKYSPNKTKIVAGITDAGENWHVFVADNGEGIADKFKESIFARFERLKKEGVKGTGLGLAIAKRIVDIHNGRVWVEDNPEGGSIFIVEIPKDLK